MVMEDRGMKRLLKRMFLRVRGRVVGLSVRARLALSLSVAVLLLGVMLLGWLSSRPSYVPVISEELTPQELSSAQAALGTHGIANRVEGGRLLVPLDTVAQAKAILAYEGLGGRDVASSLQQVAKDGTPWESQAQYDKRWQAAKMAALSRMISMFPPVRSATVIYDPGQVRGLGSAAVAPTAAVKVTMKASEEMSSKLVNAVADLVAGSIAGMSRENVRIVDGAGKSYRAIEDSAAPGQMEQLRQAQAYYTGQIQSSLAYISNLALAVNVSIEAPGAKCLGASVSIPRSYLEALHKAAGGRDGDEAGFAQFAAARLAKVQQTVAGVAGCSPSAINVDWHYDLLDQAASGPTAVTSFWAKAAVVLLAGAVAFGVSVFALTLIRSRRLASQNARAGREDADGEGVAKDVAPQGLLGYLQQASVEDLLDFVKDEHPQLTALVLAQISGEKAAQVFSGLPHAGQVEIARRIASLENVDVNVVREVERSLAARIAGVVSKRKAQVGGVGTLAEILAHSGFETERTVLEGLDGQEPALAQSVRKRMFVFEDIASMPNKRLGAALSGAPADELAISLRTASEPLKKKVLSCLASDAGKAVREQMDGIGPVRLSDVEAAQRRILEIVCRGGQGKYVAKTSQENVEIIAG
jgi:flagellar motor switch protein FliG